MSVALVEQQERESSRYDVSKKEVRIDGAPLSLVERLECLLTTFNLLVVAIATGESRLNSYFVTLLLRTRISTLSRPTIGLDLAFLPSAFARSLLS